MSQPPRVYVYPNADMERGVAQVGTGPLIYKDYGFVTDETGVLNLLFKGFKRFASAPESADLFFSFSAPYRPPYHMYTPDDKRQMDEFGPVRTDYIPNHMRLQLVHNCRYLFNGSALRSGLSHMRGDNAHRHFVLSAKPREACCLEPEFQGRAFTIESATLLLGLDVDNIPSPRLRSAVGVPYPSSIRWSTQLQASQPAPWQPTERVGRLMAFVGSLRGRARSQLLRKEIVRQCRAAPRHCELFVEDRFPLGGRAGPTEEKIMAEALGVKARTTFCLEPPGYSPPRKSMIDALLSGCIPVLFMTEREVSDFLPLHFAWKANATVVVQPRRFLAGEVDLQALLSSISAERVRSMQATIAAHAHHLVYGIDAVSGDAVEMLLRGLRAKHALPPRDQRVMRPPRDGGIDGGCFNPEVSKG